MPRPVFGGDAASNPRVAIFGMCPSRIPQAGPAHRPQQRAARQRRPRRCPRPIRWRASPKCRRPADSGAPDMAGYVLSGFVLAMSSMRRSSRSSRRQRRAGGFDCGHRSTPGRVPSASEDASRLRTRVKHVGRLAGALGRPGRAAGAAMVAACLACGCGLVGGPKTVQEDVPLVMTVTSQVVSRGVIAPRYTCHGAGTSPAIQWSGAPPGTKSLALVVDDSSAPITPYIYWIVFDIGPQTTGILDGQLPPGARQAHNSKGTVGYDPPCPQNSPHGYRFTVYALGHGLRLPSGTSAKSAWTTIAQAAIARGTLPVTANP
jgi:Raf kinase inhibitor-like YbhB/YbcL family protein